jgi:tetratricopeptide (TPR) repeat protein
MQQKPSIREEQTSKRFKRSCRSKLSKERPLFFEALALHKVDRLAEAERIYKQILATEPTHVGCLHLLGVISDQRGNHAMAVSHIESALKINPDNIFALISHGNALHALKRFDEALASCDRAIALLPDFAEAHYNRGNALHAMKRFEEALASYDHALMLRPDYADAYSNRGNALNALKRFEEALASYDRALVARPDDAEALSNRGATLHELGRFDEALASYDRALTLRPDNVEALLNRGVVLNELKRFSEALASYDRALAARPDDTEVLSNRGATLHELGRFDEALVSYDRVLTLRPDYAEAHSNRGNALMDQGRLVEAEAACRRAIELKPSFADAHNTLGAILKYVGRLADARRAVEQAIKLAPRNVSCFLNLSDVTHFGAGDPYLGTMEELAKNIVSLPVKQQIELHFALAKAYDDTGERDKSFEQLLAGNTLKRRQIAYDETATLALFERIRAVFTLQLMRTFQDVGEPTSIPIFIVGMPRSGTTLIEQILASHPQVFGAGELPTLEKAADDLCSREGHHYPFPEMMRHVPGEHLRRLGAHYISEIIRLRPNATHVTDKMPANFLFAGLIHLAMPNARIIHAVRDPVDTCMSCFSKLFASGQLYTYDLDELGRYYRGYQALMEHWHHVLPPGRILNVRYEDVAADLEGQARRIILHCGLEWDGRCLAFHETERPVHTASAAQVRKPIYGSSIGRWHANETVLRPSLVELYGGT